GRASEATEMEFAVVTMVAPRPTQEPLSPFGAPTANPGTRGSAKLTLTSGTVGFGLVMVKVTVVELPTGMATAPKDFVRVAGPTTTKVAGAALPIPAAASRTIAELSLGPGVVPVTSMLNVQMSF